MKTISDVQNMTANQLVSWFMIASYAYYRVGGTSQVMDDQTFDHLVLRLRECYDEADHIHKPLITVDHLDAGTGYDIKYPTIVKHAYAGYVEECNEMASK